MQVRARPAANGPTACPRTRRAGVRAVFLGNAAWRTWRAYERPGAYRKRSALRGATQGPMLRRANRLPYRALDAAHPARDCATRLSGRL